MLKAFNWNIVSVPYYDWYGMDNTSVKVRVGCPLHAATLPFLKDHN